VARAHQEADLRLAQQFFAERGLQAERIVEAAEKRPDLGVLDSDGALVAYCEVKSSQDVFVERAQDAIREAPVGQIAGIVERGNTSRQYRCMERAAKKAVKQFNSINISHSVPNILIFVNRDIVSVEADFVETITGSTAEARDYSIVGIRSRIPEIDCYVWLDARAPQQPRILWRQNQHRDTVMDLAIPGRRAARARVIAAGLSDGDIDRMIKEAQHEVERPAE
jgi:hypothetical protein